MMIRSIGSAYSNPYAKRIAFGSNNPKGPLFSDYGDPNGPKVPVGTPQASTPQNGGYNNVPTTREEVEAAQKEERENAEKLTAKLNAINAGTTVNNGW